MSENISTDGRIASEKLVRSGLLERFIEEEKKVFDKERYRIELCDGDDFFCVVNTENGEGVYFGPKQACEDWLDEEDNA